MSSALILLFALGCAKRGETDPPGGRIDVDGVFARAHAATLGDREPPAPMEVAWVVSAPSAGVQFPATLRVEAPSNQVMIADIPGVGQLYDGYINGVAFDINPIQGARLKGPEETAEAAYDADPRPYLHVAERYPARRLAGTAQHAGVLCNVVETTNARGRSERLFFGVEDGLPRGSNREVLSPMGPMQVTEELYDYQEVCPNAMMPTRMVMRTGPMVEELRVTGCTAPASAPALKLPPDVEALLAPAADPHEGHNH